MANQYEVLGKAPGVEDLQKLSGSNLHLQIKNLSAVTERWKYFIISICL